MITREALQVTTNGSSNGVALGISAADAYELAGITYRQLDHWARQGWVRPSLDPGHTRAGRRRYAETDVVRLDLLRHLAVSKVNTAVAGAAVSGVEIPDDDDDYILWGTPATQDGGQAALSSVPADRVLTTVERGGAWVVYNPARIRRRLAARQTSPGGFRLEQAGPEPSEESA